MADHDNDPVPDPFTNEGGKYLISFVLSNLGVNQCILLKSPVS